MTDHTNEDSKNNGKQLSVDIDFSKISLDEYFISYSPIPLRSTYLWHYIHSQCCCCNCGCGSYQAPITVAPVDTPTRTPVRFSNFSCMAFTFAILSSGQANARAQFTWSASGGTGIKVEIQVKSTNGSSYPTWTTILTNQAASDIANWQVVASPGEALAFRAIARNSEGSEDISNICTIP